MKEGEEGWLFSCDHDGCIRDFVVGSSTPTSMRRWRQGAHGLRDFLPLSRFRWSRVCLPYCLYQFPPSGRP